ncbi:MAG: hypothetical protein FWE67_07080 [Planctomycetaceae bacterium]|nr:hypothetical protein [Planctomycetaceae bacterium]
MENNPSKKLVAEKRSDPNEEQSQLINAAKKIVKKREQSVSRRSKKSEELNLRQIGMFAGVFISISILLFVLARSCGTMGRSGPRFPPRDSLLPTSYMYGGEKVPSKVFTGLEAVRTVKDNELIFEIKRVIDDGGTPSEIFKKDVPPEHNAAVMLSQQFEVYQKNPGELESLRKFSPFENGKVSAQSLSEVSDVLSRIDPKRQKIRNMLNNPEVCFTFEFADVPKEAGNQAGAEIPDTKASDFLADYVMLEEFSLAASLQKGDVLSATESLAYTFRLAQLAAEVKNPTIRVRAGEVRLKAIQTLQAVVLDPNLKEENLVYLFSVVQEQLNAWTPDSAAWIGDRASGMRVYNLIFQYGLDEALEPEEIEEMRVRGIYEETRRKLHRMLPRDNVFYLQSMQKIIDVSGEPFYRRMPMLNQVDTAVRATQGTPDETVIAEFLLRGIRDIMQFCAEDRTKCETAALAMAHSLKNTKYPFPSTGGRGGILPSRTIEMYVVAPLYGRKYEVTHDRRPRYENGGSENSEELINAVSVSYPGSLQPFIVPDFSVSP